MEEQRCRDKLWLVTVELWTSTNLTAAQKRPGQSNTQSLFRHQPRRADLCSGRMRPVVCQTKAPCCGSDPPGEFPFASGSGGLASERCVANWDLVTVSGSKEILALKPGSKETSYLQVSGDVEQAKQSFSTLQINHNYKSS